MNHLFTRSIRCVSAATLVLATSLAWTQELKPIELPKAQTDGGKPLMQALKERQTRRAFSSEKLPVQMLADLLWAACGVNRPESGKRTAPTAVNWQEIDVYVVLEEGAYLYDAAAHALKPVVAGDLRSFAGIQAFVRTAPVVLVFVADHAKMGRASADDKTFYAATDTGYISQNVYLYAASEGLATVVLGMVKKDELAKKLNLRADQKVILSQPVGYPARAE